MIRFCLRQVNHRHPLAAVEADLARLMVADPHSTAREDWQSVERVRLASERYVRGLIARGWRLRPSFDSEDISQEFLLSWTLHAKKRYQHYRPLYCVAARILRNHFIWKARKERGSRFALVDTPDRQADPLQEAQRCETAQLVRAAVHALPDSFRQVLELRYFQGLPGKVVAERLGMSRQRIHRLAFEARRRLRSQLLECQTDSQPFLNGRRGDRFRRATSRRPMSSTK